MEKFIVTPVLNGRFIIERWNEATKQYERHLPKDENSDYSKENAESMVDQCNALADNNEYSK